MATDRYRDEPAMHMFLFGIEGRESMLEWARTSEGWALNLDGSDPRAGFSLPRLELRSGPHGWRGLCFLQNGTFIEQPSSESASEAKLTAVERMRPLVDADYAAALADLLARS